MWIFFSNQGPYPIEFTSRKDENFEIKFVSQKWGPEMKNENWEINCEKWFTNMRFDESQKLPIILKNGIEESHCENWWVSKMRNNEIYMVIILKSENWDYWIL